MADESTSSRRKRSGSEEHSSALEPPEKTKKSHEEWSKLDLSEDTGILNSQLLSLIKQKEHIDELDLSRRSFVCTTLVSLCEATFGLKKLVIRDIKFHSTSEPQMIQSMQAACPTLTDIDITGCSNSSKELILGDVILSNSTSTHYGITVHDHLQRNEALKIFLNPSELRKPDIIKSVNEIRRMIQNGVPADCSLDGWSLLDTACATNDRELAEWLIEKREENNTVTVTGKIPYIQQALFTAAKYNGHSVVQVLLEHNADMNAKNESGQTALHWAAEKNSHDTARVLVEHNADMNAKDRQCRTALHLAAENNSHETLRLLLEHNADVSSLDKDCGVILHWAAGDNYEDAVRALLKQNVDVNAKDEDNRTALHWAAENDNRNIVRLLLEYNAEVEVKDVKGETALHCAAAHNSHDTLRQLLEYNADVDAKNNDGLTALHHAAKKNDNETLKVLLDHNADVNAVDLFGQTALHFVADDVNSDFEEMNCTIRLLVQKGAFVDVKNLDEETPIINCFHLASPNVLFHLISSLIAFGADVSSRNSEGETLLHLLFKYSVVADVLLFENMLTRLLSDEYRKMISVKSRDNISNSPLHLWAQMHDPKEATFEDKQPFVEKMGMILISHGALVNARNDFDQTPLHLARSRRAASLLIREKAKLNGLDANGNTPLLSRVKELGSNTNYLYEPGSEVETPSEQFRTFLQSGMNSWTENIQGETAFSVLVESKNLELARAYIDVVLSEDPPSVNRKSSTGNTPLHVACQSVRSDITVVINALLTNGANPNEENNKGETPLHVACKMAVEETESDSLPFCVVRILLQHHASPEVQDHDGQTCLAIAAANRQLIKLLEDETETVETVPIIRWSRSSETHRDKLSKVARGQTYRTVKSYFYHVQEIGSGAFSRVYAGINTNDGREIALKYLKKEKLKRREDRREIANLVKLKDCEQVVKYHDRIDDNDYVFIVLELMEGTLKDYLDKRTRANPNEDIALSHDLIKGLDFLHNSNPTVLHRDIKPSNVLYKTNPRLCLKIADFGLSTKADPDATESTVGTGSAFAGTRCWMAPEVLNGKSKHSTGSDVFSAGLVLHMILASKKHPFAPDNVSERSKADARNAIERNIMHCVYSLDKQLSPEAQHLINRMLESDPKNRPNTTNVLVHPFFWSNERKHRFLSAVANQKQFEVPRGRFTPTSVETDLENGLGKQFVTNPWDGQIIAIYNQVTASRRSRIYDTWSAVSLVRFVRNTLNHVSDQRSPWPTWMKELVLQKFEFLTKFPSLVMEVYKAVIAHGWDKEEEIQYILNETV